MPTVDSWTRHEQRHPPNRNDALNPEVLFQTLARDAAITRSLSKADINTSTARVLDVGCGSGGSLISLLNVGVRIDNMVGIDSLQERITEGKNRIPELELVTGDATHLNFSDATFDLVLASTLFWCVPDDEAARQIAREMLRVTKPGGTVLLCDWRIRDPRERDGSLPKRRVRMLFPTLQIENIERGPLLPPIGRRLSRYLPSLYFAVQRLIPPFLQMVVYTLRVHDQSFDSVPTPLTRGSLMRGRISA